MNSDDTGQSTEARAVQTLLPDLGGEEPFDKESVCEQHLLGDPLRTRIEYRRTARRLERVGTLKIDGRYFDPVVQSHFDPTIRQIAAVKPIPIDSRAAPTRDTGWVVIVRQSLDDAVDRVRVWREDGMLAQGRSRRSSCG